MKQFWCETWDIAKGYLVVVACSIPAGIVYQSWRPGHRGTFLLLVASLVLAEFVTRRVRRGRGLFAMPLHDQIVAELHAHKTRAIWDKTDVDLR